MAWQQLSVEIWFLIFLSEGVQKSKQIRSNRTRCLKKKKKRSLIQWCESWLHSVIIKPSERLWGAMTALHAPVISSFNSKLFKFLLQHDSELRPLCCQLQSNTACGNMGRREKKNFYQLQNWDVLKHTYRSLMILDSCWLFKANRCVKSRHVGHICTACDTHDKRPRDGDRQNETEWKRYTLFTDRQS